MALTALRVEHLRCIDSAELRPDPVCNLIVGDNGAGKTSLLESIYVLGRGRSFRAPKLAALLQSGADALTVFGELRGPAESRRLGLRLGAGGTEIHVDGEASNAAELARALPVQIIEPEIHELVQGGPERRRQFVDWGLFHVKHEFLPVWRRYRRALRQRNAALRSGAETTTVQAWEQEFVETGQMVDRLRRVFLESLAVGLTEVTTALTGFEVQTRYRAGWAEGEHLAGALKNSWGRDRAMGSTQVGPHRAEIELWTDGERARHRLSRGQQKLLGAALILAESLLVAEMAELPVVMLVDEPAAELDQEHVARLISMLLASPFQLFISALEPGSLLPDRRAARFHVEHGKVRSLL